MALTEDNFEILSEEIDEFTPTYENGSPNTRNGPPTETPHATGELYRDQNGALWRCTAGGTPGTWLQVLPALMAADPANGTWPAGYRIVNVTQGVFKRHTGGLSWDTVVGAAGDKVGFYGVTPVVRPSGADQAAVTLGNVDGEIGGLTVSDPPTQAEVQALRDACEAWADDLRALSKLVHALGSALVAAGVVKGGGEAPTRPYAMKSCTGDADAEAGDLAAGADGLNAQGIDNGEVDGKSCCLLEGGS